MKHSNPLLAAAIAASVPAAALALAVVTTPVQKGRFDGPWEVVVRGAPADADFTVLDDAGRRVAGPFVARRFPVHAPRLWSDESPACYRLVATIGTNRSEKVFGFRQLEVRDGRLVVNGRPVRLRFAPKRLNGNAIRATRLTHESALREGVYAVPGYLALAVAHELPYATDAATRHAFRNWAAAPTNFFSRIVVENRNAFTGSDGVRLMWTLLVDGERRDGGEFELRGLGPGRFTSFDMPPAVERARRNGGTVSVRFDFLKNGEIIATDQADVVDSRELAPLSPDGGEVSFSDKDGEMVFSTGGRLSRGMLFEFDRSTGLPKSFSRGESWLMSAVPIVLSVRHAVEGMDETGVSTALSVSPISEKDGALIFASVARGTRPEPAATNPQSTVTSIAEWTATPSGVVACRARLSPSGSARAGFVFTVAVERGESAEWFGLGPEDNSPEAHEGVFLGRWRRDIGDGALTAEAVRGVRVGDLTVRTLAAPFAVAVRQLDAHRAEVSIYASRPGTDGASDLAFTLSAGDECLTARGARR